MVAKIRELYLGTAETGWVAIRIGDLALTTEIAWRVLAMQERFSTLINF